MKKHLKKFIILGIFITLFLIYKLTPINSYLDLNRIFENRESILLKVNSNYPISVTLFTLSYMAVVALSIPGASILTLLGGFFFGPFFGTLYVNIGATSGAVIIFMISRYLLGENLQNRYEKQLFRFNRELDENGTNYLLTLRLIPLFPFFLINILAGLTNVSAKKFLWTTSLGIIPGSFIYAYIGYAGTTISSKEGLVNKDIVIALFLLGVFALIPVVIKKLRRA